MFAWIIPSLFTGLATLNVAMDNAVNYTSYRASRNVIKSYAGTVEELTITPTKTSGPAPLAVNFNIFTTNAFLGIANPADECSFWLDYDDPTATYQAPLALPFDASPNIGQGLSGGHIFGDDGNYGKRTVRAWVYHPVQNRLFSGSVDIDLLDPDLFYPGAQTVVCSSTSDYTDAPAGATQTTSWADARTAFYALSGNKRLLFKRDDDYTIDQTINLGGSNIEQVGVYGAGSGYANCYFPAGGVSGTYKTGIRLYDGDDFGAVFGLNFIGDYNPQTGAGEHYEYSPIDIKHRKNVGVWRCKMSGCGYGIGIGSDDQPGRSAGAVFQDNDIRNWCNMGIYHAVQTADVLCTIKGNYIHQDPLSPLGIDGKWLNDFDDATVISAGQSTYAATKLAIFADAANAYVGVRDATTKIIAELDAGTDYTFIEGTDATYSGATNGTHQIQLTSPALYDGDNLVVHTRHWSDHGPIRSTKSFGLIFIQNDCDSHSGWTQLPPASWPGEGTSIQSCLRFNSDGTAGAWGAINQNRMRGGDNVIVVQPANSGIVQESIIACVIEANLFETRESTNEFIATKAGNVFIKNNVGIAYDQLKTQYGFGGMLTIQQTAYGDPAINPTTSLASASDPIRVYNNTIVSLHTTANGGRSISAYSTYNQNEYTNPFTDVDEANNLLVHAETVGLPDYSPLDDTDFYRLLAGSSALNAGVLKSTVWDDFDGELVGNNASIGAYDGLLPVIAKPVLVSISDDTGTSNTDLATNDQNITITGTAGANQTITVHHNNAQAGTTTADVNGDWTFDYTGTTLEEGSHAFTAFADDGVDMSRESDPIIVSIILKPPAAPVITLDNDPDNDLIVSDGAYSVSGVVANSVVEYSSDGETGWTTTQPVAVDGSNTIYVRQTDAVGNVSASSSITFTLVNTWSTDFSTDTVGQLPANTTLAMSGAAGDFLVVDDNGTNKLRFNMATAENVGPRVIVFDDVKAAGVTQILLKCDMLTAHAISLFTHAVLSPMNCYSIYVNSTAGWFNRWTNGSSGWLGNFTLQATPTVDKFYLLFEVTPNNGGSHTLKVKMWNATVSEPASWTAQISNSSLTLTEDSAVGILAADSTTGESLIEFVSVGRNGTPAPRA